MTVEMIFNGEGAFEAFYKAQKWCKDNNISMGSMCRDEPIGLAHGDCDIAKWKNLTVKEQDCFRQCGEGFGILKGDKRHGPITIKMNVEGLP